MWQWSQIWGLFDFTSHQWLIIVGIGMVLVGFMMMVIVHDEDASWRKKVSDEPAPVAVASDEPTDQDEDKRHPANAVESKEHRIVGHVGNAEVEPYGDETT